MKQTKRAFTLIELLVVMAVSATLFTIMTLPLFNAFNMLHAGQAFADAQEKARQLAEKITAEISNAVYVRDTAGLGGQVVVTVPSDPNHDGNIDGYVDVLLDNAKIDFYVPSAGAPIVGPNGALKNPDLLIGDPSAPGYDVNDPANWKEDPTLRSPRGQVTLPTVQGLRLVRYFISLNAPFAGTSDNAGTYINPYDGLFMRRSGNRDNLFVLRRAEVDVRVFNRTTGNWDVNNQLFADTNGDGAVDKDELNAQLNDPRFFLPDGTAAKARRIRAWMARSRVVTDLTRYDMIMPIYNRNNRFIDYDGNIPRIQPLIQFTPSRVASEPAHGEVALRVGEDSNNSVKVGPDVFTTKFGAMSGLFMRLWPSSYLDAQTSTPVLPWTPFSPWVPGRPYLVARNVLVANQFDHFGLFRMPDGANEQTAGDELFDITAYQRAKDYDPALAIPATEPANFRYPFSYALRAGLTIPENRLDFIPIVPDRRTGKVIASFPITDVGNGTINFPNGDNRPTAGVGLSATPANDPSLTGTPSATRWTGAAYSPSSPTSTINQRFNVLWNDWAFMAPGLDRAANCQRFVDLRFLPTADGEPSPLSPVDGFARAQITPGSELIYGPDQIRGTNFGKLVRYTRSQRADQVGPNQYYINYVNQPEPDWAAIGFTVPANVSDPLFYDPANFVSSILQPRFRAGYLQFNSDFGTPLADDPGNTTGNIYISYRFQFTEPADVLAIDYDSREKMNVTLTVRNYAQTTLPNSQMVTITSQADVRNFGR